MRVPGPATLNLLVACIWLAPAPTAAEPPAADKAGATQLAGVTTTIELPPDGKEITLPLDSRKHATLVFDVPVVDVLGKPQGALVQKAKHRNDRVDIWPDTLKPGVSPKQLEPLAGNFRVELDDRTISVSIYEPTDLTRAIHLAKIRSTPGKIEALEQKVEEAQDEAASARATAKKAERRAQDAKETAEAKVNKARKEVEDAQAATRRAKDIARKARTEAEQMKEKAEQAEARAEQAEAKAEQATADAKRARAEAEKAKAMAANATAQATNAQHGQEQTRRQMLVTAARDLTSDRVQKLVADGGSAKRSSHGRLNAEFHYADWNNGYFVFNADLAVPPGRPFGIGEVTAVTSSDQKLETHVIDQDAPDGVGDNAVTTVYPDSIKPVTFAVSVPPGESVKGLKLRLTEHNSHTPPITFQVPNYNDVAVALMVVVSDEEEQRRRWAKQVVIGPRVAIGGCWLTSGLDGDDEMSATRCVAVGAHVTKGVAELLAVGVEAVGSWSEDAQFDRDTDDLTRSVKLFRAIAFGDVRLSGGETVPYLRLGIGPQVIRYQDDSGSTTDQTIVYQIGGGLTYRLGEHMSAGLTAQVFQSTDQEFFSVEAGLHLGYGWNP